MVINYLILYPIIIIFSSIFYSIISQNIIGILFAIGLMIDNIFNMLLKKLFSTFFPNFKLFLRPNPPKIGCSYIPKCNDTEISYGMPSGHSQSTLTIAVFWILYILNNYEMNIYRYLSIGLIIIISFMVLYSRIYIGCHNFLQVLIGSIIGTVYGIFLYKIVNLYLIDNK